MRRGRRGFASVRCDCCSSLLRVMVHGSRYDRSMGEPRGAEFLRVTAFVWLGLIGGIIPMMTDAGVFLATVFAAAGVIIGLFFMPKDQVPERYPIAYVIGGAKPLKHVVRGAYVPISEPVSP